jgi:hypothetical protein
VHYEGGQLSIVAANSTLADILKAVRSVLGADIDIPLEASRERMATQIGPAPPREVLSSLLSWTEFDYVVQSSDTDLNGIKAIVLVPRANSPTGAGAMRQSLLAQNPSSPDSSQTAAAPLLQANEGLSEANSASDTPQDPSAAMQHMTHQLQNMYEQRKKMVEEARKSPGQ